MWLTAARLARPFVNQLVLEAPGADLHATDWGAALRKVAETTPGLGLTLSGVLGWARWSDRVPPRARTVDGGEWSGLDGGGAPFLASDLDPRTGPTTELLVVEGSTPRLILRTAHATMDARGTLLVAERLFAAARGEDLEPLTASPLNDEELCAELGVPPEDPPNTDCPSPLGEARPAPLATRWVRRDVPGASGRGLLARVCVLLARAVSENARDAVRIDIPVDLRRHRTGLQSTANLTGLLRLPVGRLLASLDPEGAVTAALRTALAANEEAAFCGMARRVRWLPLGLMEWGGRRGAQQALEQGRFSTSATVSNVGRLDLSGLAAPGFSTQSAWFIPPGSPGLPLFLGLQGTSQGVTLCAAAPLGLADGGRLEVLMDHLAQALGEHGSVTS